MMVTPVTVNEDSFWEEIERKFLKLQEEAQSIVVFSPKDRDAYEIYKVKPELLKTSPKDRIKRLLEDSRLIFIETLSTDNRCFFVLAAECLGMRQNIPDKWIDNFEGVKDGTSKEIEIIKSAIKNKAINVDFLIAWGKYQNAHGFLSALQGDLKNKHEYFKNYVDKSTPRKIIQEHIYAYWMAKRWEPKKKIKDQKTDLHSELAEEIHSLTLNQDLETFWLSTLQDMIKIESEVDVLLKGRIINMNEDRINEISQNCLINPKDLPL